MATDSQDHMDNIEYDVLYGNDTDADQILRDSKKWKPTHIARRIKRQIGLVLGGLI